MCALYPKLYLYTLYLLHAQYIQLYSACYNFTDRKRNLLSVIWQPACLTDRDLSFQLHNSITSCLANYCTLDQQSPVKTLKHGLSLLTQDAFTSFSLLVFT